MDRPFDFTVGVGMYVMSKAELNKLEVIQGVCEKRIRQADAAKLLNLTRRHVQRLVNQYRDLGVEGLINKQRGKTGNTSSR